MGSFKDIIKGMTKKKTHTSEDSHSNSNWFLSRDHNFNSSNSSGFSERRDFDIGKEFEHQHPSEISYSDESDTQISSQSSSQSPSSLEYPSYTSSTLSENEYNNEVREEGHKDPLDPFTPRSTENLPEKPNITPPPPLPVKKREGPKEGDVNSMHTSYPANLEGDNIMKVDEDYGLLPDSAVDKAQNDKLEELLNDIRFLRSQNDLILELLKRIERKLP